jgi:hypothetical protein
VKFYHNLGLISESPVLDLYLSGFGVNQEFSSSDHRAHAIRLVLLRSFQMDRRA